MVESPDPERTDGTPIVIPRLLAVALVAAIALGGLALIPSQDSLVAESGLPEALPEPITEASLLDLSAPIEDVAASFMAAWVEGDGRAAAANFSSDGLFFGFGEYEPGMLPVLRNWYRSLGQQYQYEGCRSSPTNVGLCRYTFENKLTGALGRDRLTSSFHFLIEDGGIESVRDLLARDLLASYPDNDFGYIWDMFLNWVKFSAEGNFDSMYNSAASSLFLDPASIELWERYSDEFAASAPYLTEARAICRTATDRFDAAMIQFEATRPPGPGPTLEDLAASSEAAVEFSEQAVAELGALPPLFGTRIPFDIVILIWEAKIDHNRQLAAAASANDGALVSVLREKRGPEVCPVALY